MEAVYDEIEAKAGEQLRPRLDRATEALMTTLNEEQRRMLREIDDLHCLLLGETIRTAMAHR